MKFFVVLITLLIIPFGMLTREEVIISGTVVDGRSMHPLEKVSIQISSEEVLGLTSKDGVFHMVLKGSSQDTLMLSFSREGYKKMNMPVAVAGQTTLDLGMVVMERITEEEVVAASDLWMEEDGFRGGSTVIPLSAYRSLYQTRAAFNFSQAFYRIRGLDSEFSQFTINGIPFSDTATGRIPFAEWGGLNDMFRNAESGIGMGVAPMGGGDFGGYTKLTLDPELNRQGLRVSSSMTNRNYRGRLMATYNGSGSKERLYYGLSLSARWAEEGYISGTTYNAMAFMGSLSFRPGAGDKLGLHVFYAPSQRGKRAAITDEVEQLTGPQYNPWWGFNDGVMRNSRMRTVQKPTLLFNYSRNWSVFELHLAGSVTSGTQADSRIGYYNAPSPDPVYYAYLPSFHLNGSLVNYENARLAEETFVASPQLRWDELYMANANSNSGARYLLLEDVNSGTLVRWGAHGDLRLGSNSGLNIALTGNWGVSRNYALIGNMLGADHFDDRDVYTETRNDVAGDLTKGEGDHIAYDYRLNTSFLNAGITYFKGFNRGELKALAAFSLNKITRFGYFINERYPDDSGGSSPELFHRGTTLGLEGSYYLSGRHQFRAAARFQRRTPNADEVYINPRDHSKPVPGAGQMRIYGGEVAYILRAPRLRLESTLYTVEIRDESSVSFFYVQGNFGNTFVQEVSTGGERTHLGAELSLEYELSSSLTLEGVVALGRHRYTANPEVNLNFNTVNEDEVIHPDGQIALGPAAITGYRVPSGPQTAVSMGMSYRAPEYWWLGVQASLLDHNYIGISGIRRTPDFLNVEEGSPIPLNNPDLITRLLAQERLQPITYLDLTGGKSWLLGKKYLSLFIGINNLFDIHYKTGGYEQNRKGSLESYYADTLSNNPSFGSKYWHGFGRTFFINLAIHI